MLEVPILLILPIPDFPVLAGRPSSAHRRLRGRSGVDLTRSPSAIGMRAQHCMSARPGSIERSPEQLARLG